MQLGQRKPAGGWAASTRASPAEIKNLLSQFTQHLPGLEYCVQVCSLLYKKGVDWLDKVQREATKMSKEGESLACGERLREVGLFSFEKRRHRGDIFTLWY